MKVNLIRSILMPVLLGLFTPAYGSFTYQTIGYWDMDSIVLQGDQVFVYDNLQGSSRPSYNLELTAGSPDRGTPTLTNGGSGVSGEALNFISNDYALVRDIWDGYDSVTINTWLNIAQMPTDPGGTTAMLLRTGAWDLQLANYSGHSRIQFAARNSSGSAVGYVRSQILTELKDEWINVIAVFNPDLTMSITVDDVTVNGAASQMWWLREDDHMWVGNRSTGGLSFVGMMDDLKVSVVPEPATALLLSLGFLGLKRRNK